VTRWGRFGDARPEHDGVLTISALLHSWRRVHSWPTPRTMSHLPARRTDLFVLRRSRRSNWRSPLGQLVLAATDSCLPRSPKQVLRASPLSRHGVHGTGVDEGHQDGRLSISGGCDQRRPSRCGVERRTWPVWWCRCPPSSSRTTKSFTSTCLRVDDPRLWEFRSRLSGEEFAVPGLTDDEWDSFHAIIAEA
jgi:hypothetical protein